MIQNKNFVSMYAYGGENVKKELGILIIAFVVSMSFIGAVSAVGPGQWQGGQGQWQGGQGQWQGGHGQWQGGQGSWWWRHHHHPWWWWRFHHRHHGWR